jgi:hypothetical protein
LIAVAHKRPARGTAIIGGRWVGGEIVIAGDGGLDFWALQQRIPPAASRVTLLAGTTPASLIAFDLLALGDDDPTRECRVSCEATASSTALRTRPSRQPGESDADRGADGAQDERVGEPRRDPMDRSPARAMGWHQKRG